MTIVGLLDIKNIYLFSFLHVMYFLFCFYQAINIFLSFFFQAQSHEKLSVFPVDRLTVSSVLAVCATLQDLRGNVSLALMGPQPLGLAAVGGVSEVGFCIFFSDFFCIFFMCIFFSEVGICAHKSTHYSC